MQSQPIAQLFDLAGKTAIVTGAAAGIGQSIAFRLSEAGAAVMITDIDLEAAGKTAAKIESRGGKAAAVQADAGCTADAEKTVAATLEAFGCPDILVNNAGVYPLTPLFDIDEDKWDSVFDINLKGAFFYSQAAARVMIRSGRGGKIINMSSMEGLHPRVGLVHYCTAKAAVVMLTKSLALELAQHGITVNAIAPGGTMTPGTIAQAMAYQSSEKPVSTETFESYIARLPVGRIGKPDDAARVVLFLASAASDYMTGTTVVADGGYLLS